MYLTYYFTKTLSKKITNYSTSKYIKIVDRIALSQNKFLVLIEIDKKVLLLSVTDNNINILKEIDNMILESQEDESQSKNDSLLTDIKFSEILKDNLLKNKITSKFMKGNINYERDEFNDKRD